MMFKSKGTNPKYSDVILQKAVKEIEKLLKEMEAEGKDLTRMKLKKYQKTHHIDCKCAKCKAANLAKDPGLRGLREFGFKVYVSEADKEES